MVIDQTGKLPLHPTLSEAAQKGHVLKNLESSSLVAMGPLCDDGCTVVLTDKHLTAIKDNKIVLRGWRNRTDNLWDIPLQSHNKCMENYKVPPSHSALCDKPPKRPKPYKAQHLHAKINVMKEFPKTAQDQKTNVESITLKNLHRLVTAQRSVDVKRTCNSISITPKISVIIRKKQTKTDLV